MLGDEYLFLGESEKRGCDNINKVTEKVIDWCLARSRAGERVFRMTKYRDECWSRLRLRKESIDHSSSTTRFQWSSDLCVIVQ